MSNKALGYNRHAAMALHVGEAVTQGGQGYTVLAAMCSRTRHRGGSRERSRFSTPGGEQRENSGGACVAPGVHASVGRGPGRRASALEARHGVRQEAAQGVNVLRWVVSAGPHAAAADQAHCGGQRGKQDDAVHKDEHYDDDLQKVAVLGLRGAAGGPKAPALVLAQGRHRRAATTLHMRRPCTISSAEMNLKQRASLQRQDHTPPRPCLPPCRPTWPCRRSMSSSSCSTASRALSTAMRSSISR